MKLLSWNVNGLRALLRGGSLPSLAVGSDFVCMQETKTDAPIDPLLAGFGASWTFGERLGYAGVASLYNTRINLSPPFAVLAMKNWTPRGEF
ncbi:hypothetical protein FACS18949_06930 [Clostridia bacterium]|nr:hypothetical protein FACS189425_08510 [Clostridia bacterium]GHV33318.1 hypothetical protein FACS18949_06930 [Clostridia bacterium]